MSLKSFLARLWASIQNLFDGLPSPFKTAIHIGVSLVENLKSFVNSSAADILTAIIPGDIDDDIKLKLREKLPVILQELKLVDNCANITDPAQIVACAVKTLQQLGGDIQSAFLHNLSILIAQVAADGELSWSDGVYILEWYYQHQFKAS